MSSYQTRWIQVIYHSESSHYPHAHRKKMERLHCRQGGAKSATQRWTKPQSEGHVWRWRNRQRLTIQIPGIVVPCRWWPKNGHKDNDCCGDWPWRSAKCVSSGLRAPLYWNSRCVYTQPTYAQNSLMTQRPGDSTNERSRCWMAQILGWWLGWQAEQCI